MFEFPSHAVHPCLDARFSEKVEIVQATQASLFYLFDQVFAECESVQSKHNCTGRLDNYFH